MAGAGARPLRAGWRAGREPAQGGPKITISLVTAPEGPNLALRKKYDCSDPNKYNWGLGGLTNGSWTADAQNCFATNDAPTLPKHVTIDLEQPARIGTVLAGVPPFGSTKTITVAVSLDGKEFKEVGSHEFSLRKAERWTWSFAPVEARYVRLIYPDRHEQGVDYPNTFAFTTEVEVYGAK